MSETEQATKPDAPALVKVEYNEEELPDLLRLYYRRIFPYASFYRWLSYGLKSNFAQREISFTLLGDIYIRYQSFDTEDEFAAALQKRCPVKIDVGAVYTAKPRGGSMSLGAHPRHKEVVFDIDVSDYDDVRTCCSGADVCTKCWRYMAIACNVLDAAMREDFGFKHLLWVFSGRRGVHCWVCDEAARRLDDSARTSIGEYLQLLTSKRITFPGEKIHSSIRRALNIIEPHFENMIIKEQNTLGTPESIEKFMKLIDNSSFTKELENQFKQVETSEERWKLFLDLCDQYSPSHKNYSRNLRYIKEAIMLHYTYPRLDINVTNSMHHLLKSPFSVHPKTGKVSIPFSPKLVDKFDPHNVPNISLLVEEIGKYDAKTKQQDENVEMLNISLNTSVNNVTGRKKIKDYRKTSLLKPVNLFDEFIRILDRDTKDSLMKEIM